MSRIGKKPVSVPAGVTASVTGQLVKIKGSKGELSFEVPEDVSVAMEEGAIAVQPRSQSKRARALWGTSRARINNLVIGTTAGFEKRLEINGVGYKAAVAGKNLQLSLGYSHDIDYPPRCARGRDRQGRASDSGHARYARRARARPPAPAAGRGRRNHWRDRGSASRPPGR